MRVTLRAQFLQLSVQFNTLPPTLVVAIFCIYQQIIYEFLGF